jgi:hypothetical protein
MDEIPESHKLFGVNVDTSLASPEVFSTHVDLDADVLDHLKNVIKAHLLPFGVML